MAAGANKVIHLQGPWKGLMEYPHECGDGQVLDCLNVEFDGNWITQRAGRVRLSSARTVRPTGCIYGVGTSPTTDYSATLTDANSTSYATALLHDTNGRLYIGSPWPFSAAIMTIGSVAQTTATTLSGQYMTASGWTSLSSFVDGTATAGVPFAKSGTISWAQPGNWVEGAAQFETNTLFDKNLFWVRISSTAVLDATWKLSEVRTTVSAAPVIGLFHFTLKNGDVRLVVGMDDPGVSGASPRPAMARIGWYDERTNEYVPIAIPRGAKQTVAGASYSFVAINSYLLFTNGAGPVLRFNTTGGVDACAILEAAIGQDSASRSYLASVPRGKYLAYFQGRLYVAGNPASPYTIQFSEVDGADNIIPTDGSAPVGGANVWPAGNDFDISSSGSDQATGLVETYDRRLVIFSRQSIHIFDGVELLRAESRVGCIAPRSIVAIGQEIYFLGASGVYAFAGAAASLISYPVQPTLDKVIHKGAIEGAVGVNIPGAHHYRLAIPIPLHFQNRMVLVWNYQRKTWTKWAGVPAWYSAPYRGDAFQEMEISAATVAAIGTEDELLITGDYSGNLWIEEQGRMDGSNFMALAFVSFRVVGDEDESVKTWRSWRTSCVLDGTFYKASANVDGEQFYGRAGADTYSAGTLTTPAFDAFKKAAGAGPVWSGGGTWPLSISSGRGPNKTTKEVKFSIGRSGRQMQATVWSDCVDNTGYVDGLIASGRFAIRGLDIEFRPKLGRR